MGMLHPLHRTMLKTHSACLSAALLAGLPAFDAALEHCASIVHIYERVFRPEHPMLGLQLYTLGNLQHERAEMLLPLADSVNAAQQAKVRMGLLVSAAVSLRRAANILLASHGAEHTLVRGLVALLADAEARLEQARGG